MDRGDLPRSTPMTSHFMMEDGRHRPSRFDPLAVWKVKQFYRNVRRPGASVRRAGDGRRGCKGNLYIMEFSGVENGNPHIQAWRQEGNFILKASSSPCKETQLTYWVTHYPQRYLDMHHRIFRQSLSIQAIHVSPDLRLHQAWASC